jgi:hypothetical protein
MSALTLIQNGLPPMRSALVDLNRKIVDAERHLDTLTNGRDRLRSELGRANTARNELDALVHNDAASLVGKLRSGAGWALSHFGSAKAMNLVASLAESRVQHDIGQKALSSVDEEVAVLEREIADMKMSKQDAIRAVLVEASAGYVADLAILADDLRQVLAILGGLDKVTAKPTGEWVPDRRIVVTFPAIGGVREQTVVAPASTIERAQSAWRDWAEELESNPLATVESLRFPNVIGTEDSSTTVYADYSRAERHQIDLEHAQGVK